MKTLPLLIALAMASLLVSCSSSSSTPSAPTLNLITVTPTSPSVAAGLTEQFKATGSYTDGSTKDLTSTATWTSDTANVATINAAGLATTKTQGSATIKAASGSVSGATTLQVTAATLASISVTPENDTIAPGTFLQLTATGVFTDGSTQNLTNTATWSSPATAVVSVSATGLAAALVNPPPGVGASVIITAKSGTISGNTGVSVAAPTLNSIAITDGNLTIAAGTTHQYTATGIYSDGGQRDLTNQVVWGSSDTSVATISAEGDGSGVTQGTSSITATMGSTAATPVTLTVSSATVTNIVVAPVMHTLAPLTRLPLTAIAIFSDNSTQNVTNNATWTSNATNVATVDSTVHFGVVTAVSMGSVNISAALGGVTGMSPLSVSNVTPTGLSLSPSSVNLAPTSTVGLLAKATFSDGSSQLVNELCTWNSTMTSVATVDSSGDVTGVVAGTTSVTASFGGFTTSATNVTVENVASLALTPNPASIPAGAVAHVQAVATFADSTTQNISNAVILTSSAPGVALTGDSSNTRGELFGISAGTSVIGALFAPLGPIVPQITSEQLTVTSATLSSLSLTPIPANSSIPLYGSQAYKLTGTYSDGTTQVLTGQADWSSDNVLIAIVNQNGVATPTASGTTMITAAFGGMTANASLTVQ